MKKVTQKYLWILLANALLLLVVGGIFAFSTHGKDGVISPVVDMAVMNGDMMKMELFAPRKNLPEVHYMADMRSDADIRDLKGQWTLVNLWASWCAPCITEMPDLQRLNDVYEGQGFRVIAISLDTAEDALEIQGTIAMHKFGKIANNWDYNGEVFRNLTNGSLPMSFIVDPDGKVFSRYIGEAKWASPEALAFVDSLLKSSK